MTWRLLADLTVGVHGAFIAFVVLGGFIVAWRRWFVWLHVPAVVWAIWIEFAGGICPLTPLENRFRDLAGQEGYEGGFIAHYLTPLIYPEGLTREMQYALGAFVFAVNVVAYALVCRRARVSRPVTGSRARDK
jgi:hypothetical protein